MIKLEMITIKEAAEIAGGNEQILHEMFDKLRQWLQQQLHLPQEISDERVRYMLLTSKFNLEKAKKRLDSIYTLHNFIPEFFADYDPLSDSIAQFHQSAQWVLLPKLTPEKYRVTVFQCTSDDSSIYNLFDATKYIFMVLDVRAEEDTVHCNVFIIDFKNFTVNHMMKYTPSLIKKIYLFTEASGIRIKAVYVINAPTYTEYLLSVVKIIIKQKLFDRIKVFSSGIETLYDVIPKSILPEDYGGEEPSMEVLADMMREKLMERRDWLLEQEKLKTNESLRTNSVLNPDELFGVAGTFRKLEID